jgi:hypothetical protein
LVLVALLGCIHTRPHDPIDGAWRVDTRARRQLTWGGVFCAWEAEDLSFSGQPLWSAPPPDRVDGEHNEEWCEDGGESGRMVDVTGQDGPFLSTRLREVGCCPERTTVRCVTWDLRTRVPTTLEAYDEKHAEWRRKKLDRIVTGDPSLAGWVIEPQAFLVRDGHVAFCAVKGDEVREVAVR